jgi:hypothetical protein
MKRIFFLSLVATLNLMFITAQAQCPAGQTQVSIVVTTDDYGYEGYWELLPGGGTCGTATIASGGNAAQVGCTGGGAPYTATAGNGYASNSTFTSTSYCLTTGGAYTIKYIDDYGDGGFTFKVMINGFPVYTFSGSGAVQTYNFNVTPPPAYDLSVSKIALPMYGQPGAKTIKGSIFNYGNTTITSFDLNYKINSGATITSTISGVSIPGYTSYDFTHPTTWNVTTNGSYVVDAWATNLNVSNPDTNTANDHKAFTYVVGDAVPNKIDDYLHATPTFTTIANSANGITQPRDLDFHPVLNRNELWVVLKSTEAIGGKTAKISNAGLPSQSVLVQKDGNAWHFMSLPTGIAFGDNGDFCTSPGVLDANHGTGHYTGPALWSSDPAIYAMPSGGNGSHLDMLHQCPYSMGVAWEKDNVYWVFDSYLGDLMRNDFEKDHGPGNSDHSDGRIREYKDFSVARINLDIPCHLALDENKKWLYVVDGGNGRIIRMDITTGSQTGTFVPYAAEPLAENSVYTGTSWSAYINTGTMQPSGVDVIGNNLIVSDYATGDILIYDCSGATGTLKGKITTGQPGVQGVKIGPDGKIWYVNYLTNEVKRVDYTLWPTGIGNIAQSKAAIYPNPAHDMLIIKSGKSNPTEMTIAVGDITGRQVYKVTTDQSEQTIDVSKWSKGMYVVSVSDKDGSSTQKVTVE